MMKRRTFIVNSLAAAAAASLPRSILGADLAPFKLYDTHAHFYTNEPDKYPFNAKGARYGPDRMIAKAMANPITPEVVFRFWKQAGIERGLGVQYSSAYFTDNSYLLDIAAKYPEKIIPIVILDATAAQAPETLKRMAREHKIAGVRFMGAADASGNFPYLTDAALGTWEMCNELGLSITLLPLGAAGAALPRVGELATRYPNVAVVLDHIGFPTYSRSPKTFGFTHYHLALAGIDNINYKYTTFLIEMLLSDDTPLKEFCEYSVAMFGADHMIWGSDIGNSEVNDLEFVQHALDSAAGLTSADKHALFYDTATKLFIPGGRGPKSA
jgi:predicted TIM-barrel fold metal-dependent hydrolase